MTHAGGFTIHVEQLEGFAFRTRFDKQHHVDLFSDEPPPLGKDSGPNPARILAAAVGNCLSASLLFCLSKAGISAHVDAEVTVELVRNERKRLRIGTVDVTLHTKLPENTAGLEGCLDLFEDFCVVTESVREGLDVRVHVKSDASSIANQADIPVTDAP
jgi:uncharacterized OsmC-like protein